MVYRIEAVPRFATTRNEDHDTWGYELIEWAKKELGIDLLEWQKDLVLVALEHVDGIPVHDVAAILSVPRQNGKSFLVRLIISWWASRWNRQKILYVAQTRLDARMQIMDLGEWLLERQFPIKIYRGVPERLLFLDTGGEVSVASPSHTSVHGQSLDLAVVDESWASLSPGILQGLVPARAARPNSMLMMLTTMGTEDSETWNLFRDRGRDGEDGICYVEYSMDPDTNDLYDEEQWSQWMPALDKTVSRASVRAGMSLLSPSEARRAYGNITTSTDFELFDMEAWHACQDPYLEPPVGDIALSLDANPHLPNGATIVATWQRADDDRWHTSVVEYQPGGSVLWLVDRMRELIPKFKPVAVTLGHSSATRAIAADVQSVCAEYVVPYRKLTSAEMNSAGVLWADSLRDGDITHHQADSLDIAMQFAVPKQSEDGWRLDRKGMRVDGSPLAAAIAGLFVAQEEKANRPTVGIF